MFVLFSRLLGHFESLAFFNKWGQISHQSNQTGYFSQFSKVQQLSIN